MNQPQLQGRPVLQAEARSHRNAGKAYSKIASIMGLTKGHVWSLLAERAPQSKPPEPSEGVVVKRRTNRGSCSSTCRDVFIAMPRITVLDGPFIGSAALNGATVH
ncbi:hypothetical protein IAE29_21555 [Ochrobactrum sp. S46]|nr:hypothetical protein [Ochrobactrum sp. S45]MBK0045923.1 hypothetical protein [Ochrobactrum sp. S46]